MSREQGESQRLGSARELSNIYDMEHVSSLLERFRSYHVGEAAIPGYPRYVFDGYTENGHFVHVTSIDGLADNDDRAKDYSLVFGNAQTGSVEQLYIEEVGFTQRRSGGMHGHVLGAHMSLQAVSIETGQRHDLYLTHDTCTLVSQGDTGQPEAYPILDLLSLGHELERRRLAAKAMGECALQLAS